MTHEYANTEIPRDRWQRPLVVPPGGGTRQPYTRTTTFVGSTEDNTGLSQWFKRQTALGMSRRPDLVMAAAACDAGDKKKLGEIAEKALEHAGSSAAASVGTALHSMTERVDRGDTLGDVPMAAVADIGAYLEATKDLKHLAIEQFRVFDDWRVAGTCDRVVTYQGRNYIADIKTGSIDYPHKIASQLAMYSRSTPYDIESDERLEQTAGLELSRGIIIHLPAGTGTCTLQWVDLEAGWRGCQIAKTVRDWRTVKRLTWAVDVTIDTAVTAAYENLVAGADTLEALIDIYRDAEAGDMVTDALLAACKKRKAELLAQ